MDQQTFSSMCDYVEFDVRTAELLAELHPHAAPHFPAIVDDFYATIEAHPGARSVLSGPHQVARLKGTLTEWLGTLLKGPHDYAYVQARSRIGRVHVRISLPQQYMFTAMNRIRQHLLTIVHDAFRNDPERCTTTAHAVDKIADLELAIMLESYRSDLLTKIRTQERLATIGQLAASIGHELRNPLGIVESSLYLIDKRTDRAGIEDDVIDKHLDRISKQVKHCNKTITDLLELARDRPPKRRPVSVRGIVDAALEAVALPDELELQVDAAEDVSIVADPDQLRQVVVNLIANASAATQGRGHVTIEAERENGGTAIYVTDDGPGVPPADRERIFDALFTTKAKGTGLGLALCRRILEAHGGEMHLQPSESGARFRLWILDEVPEA